MGRGFNFFMLGCAVAMPLGYIERHNDWFGIHTPEPIAQAPEAPAEGLEGTLGPSPDAAKPVPPPKALPTFEPDSNLSSDKLLTNTSEPGCITVYFDTAYKDGKLVLDGANSDSLTGRDQSDLAGYCRAVKEYEADGLSFLVTGYRGKDEARMSGPRADAVIGYVTKSSQDCKGLVKEGNLTRNIVALEEKGPTTRYATVCITK